MPQQQWLVTADGGAWANEGLSRELRVAAQPLMRFLQPGFVRIEKDYGKGKSDKINFDKVSNVQTEGRAVAEDEISPKTKVQTYKGEIIVSEYMNAIDYTGKLELLSQFSPDNIIHRALRDDMAKVRDKAAAAAFQKTKLVYVPTGTLAAPTYTLYTTGTPLVASTRGISTYDVKVINRLMKIYNIPLFDGQNFMAVGSVNGFADLSDDPTFERAALYGDPERLFTGEIKNYSGVRFLEENNSLNGSLPGGCGEVIFFGADPAVQGLAMAPEIRYDIPRDFGRQKGLCWISLEGFEITWDYETEGETHVLRVYSA